MDQRLGDITVGQVVGVYLNTVLLIVIVIALGWAGYTLFQFVRRAMLTR